MVPQYRIAQCCRQAAAIVMAALLATQAFAQTPIPRPTGMYVLNEASNLQSSSTAYAIGLVTSPAYQNNVAGHAIFVPIAKILPSVSTWGQFDWDWTYVDSLVQIAVANGKQFSIELETGFQSSSTYLQSLPAGFAATCGADCAPLFDVWTTGGGAGRCVSAYVLLPWIPNVQQFWNAAALALAAHLRDTGVYGSLTLVHVPGLSVYDEEIRLPTGTPSPDSTDTTICPDGRPAYPTTITDAATARWQALGYSDAAVIGGFSAIATSFAQAFPDRYLGLSLFPTGSKGIDFPNLTGDPVGYVASQIVQSVAALVPNRIQVQSDNLDSNAVDTEVTGLADLSDTAVGWQSNKHGGVGAGCAGGGAGSCAPDGSTGPFFQLLQSAALSGGRYLEVWSSDVVAYPQAFAAAMSAGVYQANYQGLWWAAGGAESGSGINFAHQGDQVFATWYTYDTSGKAWWLAMLAGRTAPGGNVYAGPIYVESGPPFNNYVGKASPTQVGDGMLTFSDANTGSFSYTVTGGGATNVQQILPIVRYDTGLGVQPVCVSNLALDLTAATNYQGLWWVPGATESGWGINFAQQGNDIFATWYTYDLDGTPLWLAALTQRQGASNIFTGAIYRTSGPRFDAYDPRLVQTMPVGTATLTFADGNDATFSYSVMVAPLPGPVVQIKPLTRYPFTATGGTVCQ